MIRATALALLVASLPVRAGEVLTIDEAAELLRVTPQKVLSMANARRLPARDVDGEWRLSRTALLEWLKGAGDPLSVAEMSATSGRGYTPAGEIGEKPAMPTAEQVALREQGALLKGGMRTVEFGTTYSRSERETFPVARTEARLLSAAFTGRYGLKDDLQATARVTANYRRNDAQVGLPGESAPLTDSVEDRYFGDASVSLLYVAQREAMRRPNVIWTLDAVLPTGPGDSGLGTGITLSKSYDPLVLFGGLAYMRGISVDLRDPRRGLAQNNWRTTLGYAYAVNESLALNSSFASTYRSPTITTVPGTTQPTRERHQLQFGMTWLVDRGLFIEPSVAFAVGTTSPDVTISLNVPYTF